MNEPEFDANGYPTETTLEAIRTWPHDNWVADFEAAMDFVGRAWKYPEYWKKIDRWEDPDWPGSQPQLVYIFSTIGWSGNEDLVAALEANLMLHAIGSWSWRRGGHYEYRFPVLVKP